MTSAVHRFRIVVALDRSEYAEVVLEHAIDQAARHDAPDLHFLTVVRKEADVEGAKQWVTTQVLQGLDTLGERIPEVRTRLHVVVGSAAEEIATLAADLRADLLVIGRFGVHERKGSIADRVLKNAACPTLVVGLTERTFDQPPQCPDCVAIRESSDGERWFCAAHADNGRLHDTTLVSSTMLTHGGPLL